MAAPDDDLLSKLEVVDEASQVGTVVKTADMDNEMERLRESRVVHHLYLDEATGEPWPMTDELIVTFEEPPTAEILDELLNTYALVVTQKLTARDYVLWLTDDTGMNPVKLLVKLTEERPSGVRYVEHNLQHRIKKYSPHEYPKDPYYGNLEKSSFSACFTSS